VSLIKKFQDFKSVLRDYKSLLLLINIINRVVSDIKTYTVVKKYLIFGHFFRNSYRLKNRLSLRPTTPPPALPGGGKIYAFYLPQYHQIPENDLWWGEGFTDWVNVKRAKPLFRGHYQPRIPLNGYYDLKNIEVMAQQAKLAKDFGIDAFIVYYYWFSGKRLLEKPLDSLISNPQVHFPFVLCWANENWTRKWDGNDQEILIEQNYIGEWVDKFYTDIVPYLVDDDYQRFGNKIILLVYRPDLIPSFSEFSKTLKAKVKAEFALELVIFGPNFIRHLTPTFPLNNLDQTYEFPPRETTRNVREYRKGGIKTKSLLKFIYNEKKERYNLHPGVFTSWDTTARRGKDASIVIPNSPRVFRELVYHKLIEHKNDSQLTPTILFINAWNEWAEGAHLEPDEKYGYQWLWAVYDAKTKFSKVYPAQ